MMLIANVEKKIFHNNIHVINFGWDFSIISSRRKDPRLPLGTSMQKIFDPETQLETYRYLVDFLPKPLLVDTYIGPAIISNSFYHSSLMALVCFPDTDVYTVAEYAKNSDLLILSESLKKKLEFTNAPTEINKESYFETEETVNSIIAPMKKAITFIPTASENILTDMCDLAQMISELCGCHTEISSEGEFIMNAGERYKCDPDLHLFSAALTVILLLARSQSKNRSAKITIQEKDESPFVTVAFEPLEMIGAEGSDQKPYSKELFAIRSVFQNLNTLFYTLSKGNNVEIGFIPVRYDWSILRIKTEDGLLIEDVDFHPDGNCSLRRDDPESSLFSPPQA